MRLSRALVTTAAVAALALAGCGDDAEPDTGSASSPSPTPSVSDTATPTPSPSKTVPRKTPAGTVLVVRVDGDSVRPVAEALEVGVGETLTLSITSDRAGELHVHSTPEQMVEFPAGANEYDLTFDKPGQVDVEEHDSGVLIARVLVR